MIGEIFALLFVFLTPLFLFLIVSIIWYFWSKDKCRTEIFKDKEMIIKRKLNRLIWKQEAPFGEIRYPIMLITCSSFVFIIITLGFGASIDTHTGQPVWEIDWNQYFDEETGLYDPWVVSPMDQFMINNRPTIFAMLWFGYCGMICVLVLGWFQYMKWRWEHIPVEKQIILKRVYKDVELERIKRKKRF
ncbi:unnamed protein product [marine sediment metagenome]|uniref:Uncharacterized protein n=1 Tax=marine sediment metagenome TaxID=412755 RepID=X1KKB6_9ZZZZ